MVEAWARSGLDRPLVRVVPIRAMEAGALADEPTLRATTGADLTGSFEADLLPRVERLSDPKRTLGEAVAAGRRRRVGRRPDDYLPILAETLPIDALRQVPSFQAWWVEAECALRRLGYLAG